MTISVSKRPAKARFRKVGRGSVMLIAGLLMSSAALRLISGSALAENNIVSPAAAAAETSVENSSHLQPAPNRAEMGSLLEALLAREARLKEREKQIELRSKALQVADEEINKRMTALKKAEDALRQTLALADGAAEGDLARLTSVYESMKPKEAAALFETMEPAFAAGFLGRMRPEAAADVMAGLSPELAYSISVILAGRNANAPKT